MLIKPSLTIAYNYLNLPPTITFANGNIIDYTYDASGKKLTTTRRLSSTTTSEIQHYLDGIEYKQQVGTSNYRLEAIYHPEGRIYNTNITDLTNTAIALRHEFCIKDHLGNTRITFADKNSNGQVDLPGEILQENHYYPFGMNMNGPWMNDAAANDKAYQYNDDRLISTIGRESSERFHSIRRELRPTGSQLIQFLDKKTAYVNTIKLLKKESFGGLGWNDYGARFYDPSIGRFTTVDDLSDHPNQIDKSPYAYTWNNPVNLTDPDGNCPTCPAAAAGAVIGGLIGGGLEIASQLINKGTISDWNAVGGSAIQGAVTGAVAGFTAGTSLLGTAAASGGANAVGGTLNRSIQGQNTTLTDVATDATVGTVLGAGGKLVGNAVSSGTNNLSNSAKGKLGEVVTEIKYGAQGYKSAGKAEVLTGGKTPTGRDAVAKYDHNMTNIFTGKKITVESKFNGSTLTRNQTAAQSRVGTSGGLIIDRTTSQGLGNVAKAATVGAGSGVDGQRNKRP
jgi:RHS repeat-associated protein